MEHAAALAMEQQVYSYRYFEKLLADMKEPDAKPILHENLRGSEYYEGGSHA
jgi:hypothetical protein